MTEELQRQLDDVEARLVAAREENASLERLVRQARYREVQALRLKADADSCAAGHRLAVEELRRAIANVADGLKPR